MGTPDGTWSARFGGGFESKENFGGPRGSGPTFTRSLQKRAVYASEEKEPLDHQTRALAGGNTKE